MELKTVVASLLATVSATGLAADAAALKADCARVSETALLRTIVDPSAAAEVLREVVPDITLRTTNMTGFPGGFEARFRELMADLKRRQFDNLGAFAVALRQDRS